jgi:hypothetical protein
MPAQSEVRQKFRQLLSEGKYGKRDLNYVVASSSGLNVTQEIPDEAYKRAAWASNQGASFIELSIGGPAQIYNEWDNLISISRQLGLSYDAHFPVQVPFDYATPYREQREHIGYEYAHEFMYEFITAWGEFKEAIESQPDVNGNQQHVYGLNAHLVKSTIPTADERMAGSVSVDIFGDDMMESKIFANPAFRVAFFKYYMWEQDLRDNFNTLQSIANDIEGFADFNILQSEVFVNYMQERGYLTQDLVDAVAGIGDEEQIKETIRFKAEEGLDEFDEDRIRRILINRYNEEGMDEEDVLEKAESELASNSLHEIVAGFSDEELDFLINGPPQQRGGRVPNPEMLRGSALQAIAGTNTDPPEDIDELEDHGDAASIATTIPRFDPFLYVNTRWSDLIPRIFWEIDEEDTLRDQETFQNVLDGAYERLKNELRDAIIDRLKNEDPYDGHRDYLENLDRQLSVGEVAMRDIVNFRGGYYRDELSRPSVIFWELLPRWMPFCDIEPLKYIWREITGIDPDKYGLENIDEFEEELWDLRESHQYDRPIAAGAGAYVWGHFTQYKSRGQEMTLVELLDRFDLTMDWESHNIGNQGNGKLWKPFDIIKVCEAINDTEVNGETHEVMFCTIDMEHLAINGIDPLWVIQGNEEKGYRGLDEGDGMMITKQHVTRPALSEQKHHHQPIRRGDTVVYEHLDALVEKGFCQRDDRPSVVMYELGAEKAESIFMLRLMMKMLEMDISTEYLRGDHIDDLMDAYDRGDQITLEDYLVLKFFGLTDEEWQHEWQEIFEHAYDPLDELLESKPSHLWSGQGALQHGEQNQPDDEQRERYQ